MKVKARANGNVIDLPDGHPLIGVLYDPVDEPKAKASAKPAKAEPWPPPLPTGTVTTVQPLTTKDTPLVKKKGR